MDWALKDPNRFLAERAALQELFDSQEWFTALTWRLEKDFALEADIDITIYGRTYAGTLTYPDLFPQTLPFIRPRNKDEHWTQHQYGPGGSLCLEWRADNWNPSITAAQLVTSAHKLLSTEANPEAPAQVPSAHQQSFGQEARNSTHRLVVSDDVLSRLIELPIDTALPIQTRSLLHRAAKQLTTVWFVTSSGEGEDKRQATELPNGIRSSAPLFAWNGKGFALKSAHFDGLTTLRTVQDLVGLLEKANVGNQLSALRDSSGKLHDALFILMGSGDLPPRAIGVEGDDVSELKIVWPRAAETRLPDEYALLKDIRVSIVGLGSIGSKVAVSLARAGVRKFLLIDDDLLLPENLCRHELSWCGVGLHKAEAVREQLLLIAPGMDVEIRLHRFAGQESAISAASVLKEIGACELIIDATADSKVFLRLAALARNNKRAICWAELYAGGIGGLIARARPDLDPNPLAVRDAINQYFAGLSPAPFMKATGYDDVEEEPLIADDADVSLIASSLTRLALDTAITRSPSMFPCAAYLIGLKKEWEFTQPFDTHPIQALGPGWEDDVSWQDNVNERGEVLKALLEIAGIKKNDHAEPPQ